MKPDTIYKRAFNSIVDILSSLELGERVPSENQLCDATSVSRTTVRKALSEMAALGIISPDGKSRRIERLPDHSSKFPEHETVSAERRVEKSFMEWVLRTDQSAGASFDVLDLSRALNVPAVRVSAMLDRFGQYGLVRRQSTDKWCFAGLDQELALQLWDIRELFETRSALAFSALPPVAKHWQRLWTIRRQHEILLSDLCDRYYDFSDLDERFHRLINYACPNPVSDTFCDVISLVFHYHYHWNKDDELQRNGRAIREHIDYIDALLSRNPAQVSAACECHLASARTSLLASLRK